MSFLNYRLVIISDGAVIFGEDVIGWEGSFAFREFGMDRSVGGSSECSGVDPECRWNLIVGGYAFGETLGRVRGI